MKKKLFSIILMVLMLGLITSPVLAQDYLFQLARAEVNVFIKSDGTATITYLMDFNNQPGAHAIDFVDIGTPNDNYDIGSISAQVDGNPLYYISSSEYQGSGTGFAVGLEEYAIQSGQSGTVYIEIGTIDNMLYLADEPEDYASFNFSPNYFGSQYVSGNTDYTVTLYLPEGMNPDEPRYFTPQNWPGQDEPEAGFDEQGRVYYRWHSTDADGSTQYIFGAGFPKLLVPAGVLQTKPLFNIDFKQIFDALCPSLMCLLFIGVPIFIGIFGFRQGQKRKMKYLPPKITIEGHGIKRGLTAVEAAVLMEQPVDKIFTMILFSVIKKGAASVISKEPMKLELHKVEPDSLRTYEIEFLQAFEKKRKADQTSALQTVMVRLIKSVAQQMKGFSHKETVAYYKEIMLKAWRQVQDAETPEVKMQKFDESMDWTMLDRDFDERMEDVFRTGPVFVPVWWGHFDPTFRTPGPSLAPSSRGGSGGGGGQTISMPNLPGSAFAASMVTGVQNFSSEVVGNITSFTNGVTKVTNPPPPPSTSSHRGGGGGGGCACACACAGCACACAGGGR